MKKILLLFALLLTITSAAFGESLFPVLSTPAAEPNDLALSYSGFANVAPDKETDFGADGKLLSYSGVSEESYLEFGEYLAQLGFEVLETNVDGRSAEMKLDNGKFIIGVSYNAEDEILLLIYESGVDIEKKDYFPGYKEISLGEFVEIPGMGTLSVVSYEYGTFQGVDTTFPHSHHVSSAYNTKIRFSFRNKSSESFIFNSGYISSTTGRDMVESDNKNNMFDIDLYYITSEGKINWGRLTDSHNGNIFGECIKYDGIDFIATSTYISNYQNVDWGVISPAEPAALGFGILADVFNSVRESADGHLAIVFTPADSRYLEENVKGYVLYLRKDGQKIGKW